VPKKRIAFVLCLLAFASVAAALPQGAPVPHPALTGAQVQQLVQESRARIQATLDKEMFLPGVAVAFVSRDQVLWSEAFGYRDASRTAKVDTDTLFGILSMSKTVTVTGLMMAAQDGLIDLEAPIARYLPGFGLRARSAADPMSVITIRHLLSMTSGLTHDAPVGNNADPFTPSYEAHIRSISQTWLRFSTGERAEYSNLGVELAAYILGTVTRRPFDAYIHDKVFVPLGMTRSTYDPDVIRKDGNRATGHNRLVDRVPLDNPMPAPGGVYASVTDMARFVQFHLNGGEVQGTSLLGRDGLRRMQTIPFPMPGQIAGYGQGLFVGYYHLSGEDVRWLGHGGGGFGFRCQMKWLPEFGYGAIVLTNSQDHDNVNENEVEAILLRVVELATGKKDLGASEWLAAHTPPRTVEPGYLPNGLEGRYNGTNDDMLFVIRDGRFGYVTGTAFVPVTPVSPDEYLSRRFLYRFVRDAAGRAVSVVRPYDGAAWLMGSPKDEPAGPAKPAWHAFTGTYVRKRFGVAEKFYVVSAKNGWLHFEGSGQDFRLREHVPGLFFTPDGEAVDFRSSPATFRNIRLYKVRD
jgi:CubicO group peptidase (beta-lactamase class C family)